MKTSTGGGRIPRTLPKFDKYLRAVVAYLIAGGTTNNGTRLGLTAAEITQAQGFLTQWFTGTPASPGIYELHSSPVSRTKETRAAVLQLMKSFFAFFQPLLVRMSGSPAITDSDRLILNIASRNSTKTNHQVAITDLVYFDLKSISGGSLKATCRTTRDSKRGARPKEATAVEISYKLGDPAPATAEDPSTKQLISTHSSFVMKLGVASAGQHLHAFARWINAKHPELNGPWSTLVAVYIS